MDKVSPKKKSVSSGPVSLAQALETRLKAAARITTITFSQANAEGKQNVSVNENGHLFLPEHLHRAGSSLGRSPSQGASTREALGSTKRVPEELP